MKKTVLYTLIIVGITTLLLSCIGLTHKIVVDENNPVDQNAVITFVSHREKGVFLIKDWNNINVMESFYGGKAISSNDRHMFTVPSGDSTFIFDVRYTFDSNYTSTAYTIENVELQFYLEAGKNYQVRGRYKGLGLFKGHELFVEIYDMTNSSTLLREWKVGETGVGIRL
ncbi:MAG: hypothetical protein FWG99_07670 [Treponema sp.]|nr:hypothetical protein [Treponema sp.]